MPLIELGKKAGVWALAALIPLILMYLVRPKPKTIQIPSLMFFIKSSKKYRINSFLKRIVKDWLFVIQFILIFFLAIAFAEPLINYMHDITAKNTVLIIDASASTKTTEGTTTRFEKGIEQAKAVLGTKNTIIVAKGVPFIGIKDAGMTEAFNYLSTLKPTDSDSKIGDAIILGGELLAGKEGRLVVFSDFINTGGQDVETAKKIVEARGTIVDFVNTAGENKKNTGFINLEFEGNTATAYIKNFNNEQKTITLAVGGEQKQITLAPFSTEAYSFVVPEGILKLEITTPDDLMTDNTITISSPTNRTIKVMLITNKKSPFLENALKAQPNVLLDIAIPPVVKLDNEHDIYIIHKIDPEQVLPGTLEDILKKVKKQGKTAIVCSQENTDVIDYKGLLPLKITGKESTQAFMKVQQLNRFTKDIEFGYTQNYFTTQTPPDTATIVSAGADNAIIALAQAEAGKLVYYGINEEETDFKFSPSYPIFWTELLLFLTDKQDLQNLNYKTTDALILSRPEKIKTPKGTVEQSSILLEDAGIYKTETRTIAANLLNELESDINPKQETTGTKSADYKLRPVKEPRKYNLELVLAGAALFLLLFELLFVKLRGEL